MDNGRFQPHDDRVRPTETTHPDDRVIVISAGTAQCPPWPFIEDWEHEIYTRTDSYTTYRLVNKISSQNQNIDKISSQISHICEQSARPRETDDPAT